MNQWNNFKSQAGQFPVIKKAAKRQAVRFEYLSIIHYSIIH